MGSLYIERVQYDVAEKYLVDAYAIRKEKLGPYHSRTGQTLKHLMTLYQSQENVPKSIECGVEAMKIYEKIGGPSSLITVANVLVRLAELYSQSEGHKSEKARKSLERALEIKEAKMGPDHREVTDIKTMIRNLSIPPPPPPPSRPLFQVRTMEVIEEKPAPVIDQGRSALLDSIRAFGEKKAAVHKKPIAAVKLQNNVAVRGGWWKQNYHYDLELPVPDRAKNALNNQIVRQRK